MKILSHSLKRKRGFALVATLSLMILLAILAVGMLGLSSVSLRSSSQGNAQAEARANARMALMLAIGELQKELGPDQRISMTADQRMEPGGDGSTTSSAPGNQHWTGVYDSWPDDSESRPTPTFRRWLVSGNEGEVTQEAFSETAVPGIRSVELVGENTAGSDITKHVKVPAVEVARGGRFNGRMAWWVGDQGVKAAMATQPATIEKTLGALRGASQGAPRNALELASTGSVKPFAALKADDPRTPLVTSWRQAGFLASDPGAPEPLFHDLTAYSSGLLTNLRSGGFRKDLSMKLESHTTPPDLTRISGQPSPNVLYYVQNEEGINFQELWAYYHLYKQLQYGGGGSYTTGGSVPASAPYLRTEDSLAGVARDNWDRYKQPIVVSYQLVVSFEMRVLPVKPGIPAGQKGLFVTFDPIITLWNPLDVAVDIPQVSHVPTNPSNKSCYMYVFWQLPYDINVNVNSGSVRKCSITKSLNNDYQNTGQGDNNLVRLNAGLAERLTLRPGEVLKISQTGNTTAGNGGFRGLDGRKGFNYGGGTTVPLLDEDGEYVLLNPSDSITYTATPNNLTSGRDASGGNIVKGGNSRRWSTTHNSVVLGSPWGNNVHLGMVGIDHCSGYSRAKVGETRTGSTKTAANSKRVYANDPEYAEVYRTIAGVQDTRTISAASIDQRKATFMLHYYNMKTEEENARGGLSYARLNPKAHNVDFFNLAAEELDLLPYQPGIKALTSWLNAPLDESTDGRGFFGSSLGSELGSNFVNTHGVPRQPIISLAAFQDSFANGFNRLTETAGSGGNPEHANARMPLLPQISHAIGNSLAPSLIAPDKTEGNLKNNPRPLADHSYLANRALWDDWFLSGIAPQPSPAYAQNRDQRTVANEFFEDGKPLPVARYMPVLGGQDASQLVSSFFSGAVPNENAINKVASYLRVDGMFNVNSTSVEAWKTLLGTLKGRQIVVRDQDGVESIAAKDNNTPFAGAGAARDVITRDGAAIHPDQWYGRRTLTDDEIDGLAEAIVKEIRKRGPFLSLADFVNRRLGSDPDLARSGAIQSALDSEDVLINKGQNTNRTVASAAANRFEFPKAEEGAINYGAPSYVKQADILTPIAPILSARSDSFIIRAYGEVTDTQGNVLARAWCEATVERDRNYVDPSEEATVEAAELQRAINRNFGRQFTLVSFRWLNSREI